MTIVTYEFSLLVSSYPAFGLQTVGLPERLGPQSRALSISGKRLKFEDAAQITRLASYVEILFPGLFIISEFRSYVKVEVAVLGFPS